MKMNKDIIKVLKGIPIYVHPSQAIYVKTQEQADALLKLIKEQN